MTSSEQLSPAAIAETHVSTVMMIGDRAYKLKKPVQFGFLDFREREARRHACLQEVLLNRRLAPDVYLGVADVTDADGRLCDHLVVMRRMPEARRLSTLVQSGEDAAGWLRSVARVMASFHERAERGRDIDRDATVEAVRALWDVNLAEMRPFIGAPLDPAMFERVRALCGRYLSGRAMLFQSRIEDRHAVDGHGDLLADDIYCLDDGPRVLDCLEFDPHLRHGDVLLDVAMLAMDLERLGRDDLALHVIDEYDRFSGVQHPRSLLHHYIAYRALVRSKIACLRHAQGDASAAGAAADLIEIAVSHLERCQVALLLVGGAPGTGKSTLAHAFGDALGWSVLSSDVVRRRTDAESPDGTSDMFARGRYAPDTVARVYLELVRRADRLLRRGESVILDATWRDPGERHLAALAASRAGAACLAVACDAPERERRDRVAGRSARGDDPSDASVAVADRIAAGFAPWPEALCVDTTRGIADQVDAVAALVERGR